MNMFSGMKGAALPDAVRRPPPLAPQLYVRCRKCGGLITPMCINPRLGCRCAL